MSTSNDQLAAMSHVLRERERQDLKWGANQTHPYAEWLAILMEEVGEASQAMLHDKFGGKAAGTFKTEMIHVAAVALEIIEQLERETQ